MYDCIEKILQLLTLTELLNLTDTNKELQSTGQKFYEDYHKNKRVTVDIASDTFWVKPNINLVNKTIEITGYRNALRFIRIFGEYIQNLEINYGRNAKLNKNLNEYVSKYTKSIQSIDFGYDYLKNSLLSFYKITECNIRSVNFGNKIKRLEKNFPNLKILRLSCYHIKTAKLRLKNLQELDIWIHNRKASMKKLKTILKLNEQIKTVKIRSDRINLRNIIQQIKNKRNILTKKFKKLANFYVLHTDFPNKIFSNFKRKLN